MERMSLHAKPSVKHNFIRLITKSLPFNESRRSFCDGVHENENESMISRYQVNMHDIKPPAESRLAVIVFDRKRRPFGQDISTWRR